MLLTRLTLVVTIIVQDLLFQAVSSCIWAVRCHIHTLCPPHLHTMITFTHTLHPPLSHSHIHYSHLNLHTHLCHQPQCRTKHYLNTTAISNIWQHAYISTMYVHTHVCTHPHTHTHTHTALHTHSTAHTQHTCTHTAHMYTHSTHVLHTSSPLPLPLIIRKLTTLEATYCRKYSSITSDCRCWPWIRLVCIYWKALVSLL